MEFMLGIDLGAATCAVAARRGTQLEPCPVGEHTATMPAVAVPRADGTVLVGEEADRRSPFEPTLVARLVASRLDEPTPTVVDGQPCDPLALAQALLAELVERSVTYAGARPDHLVLTYPLRNGEAGEALLGEASERATGITPTLVPEPVAAVAGLAHHRDIGVDTTLAVVDAGGASTDVALVRRTQSSFDLVGEPASLPGLGGTDLDAAVLSLVESAIGDVTSMVGTADRSGMLGLRRLRASCRRAKERLSSAPAAVVPVALLRARGHVEITRDAFERAVEPDLRHVADLVASTVDRAGLFVADIDAVLLVGGSARVPLLTRLLTDRTGLEVVTTDEPELATALGAALFADVAVPLDRGPIGAVLPAMPFGDAVVDTGEIGPPVADPWPTTDPPVPNPPVAPWPIAARPAVPDPPVAPWPIADRPAVPDPPVAPWPIADRPVAPWPIAGLPAASPADAAWPEGEPPALDRWGAAPWSEDDRWELEITNGPDAPASRWDDDRTSVFDPPSDPGPGRDVGADPASGEVTEWGQTSDDEVRRLRTSDTDPFGSRGSLRDRHRQRRREHDDDWGDDDERRPAIADARFVIGGAAAAALALLAGGYAVLWDTSDPDDTSLAIAEAALTTTSTDSTTSSTAAPTTTTTATSAEAPAADEPDEAPTTTEDHDEPTTSAPPPTTTTVAPSPPPPPPTTTSSSTTSTTSSTTTSTSSTTSTTLDPD
jgi:actin-like ATPase involved in cell morphogenesis